MAASFPTTVKAFTTKNNGDTIQGAHVDDLQDEVTALEQDLINGMARVRLGGSTLTIASDAVTATKSLHAVDTESAAATDDLSTISAGSGVASGHLLVLYAANVARVVTVKDSVGNITLYGGDYALDSAKKSLILRYDGTNFVEVARASLLPSSSAANLVYAGPTSGGATTPTFRALVAADLPSGDVRVLDRQVTTQTVASSVTETTLYTFSVVGGTLGSTKSLRITLFGDWLNSTGGGVVGTFRLKYGGTTIMTHSHSMATNANRQSFAVTAILSANNATNLQTLNYLATAGNVANNAGGATTTVGSLYMVVTGGNTGIAIDSTANQTLLYSVQHDTNSASDSFRLFSVLVELV